MEFLRGELWWADLPEPDGSAPDYRRPVIVLQSDAFNRSRLATVAVLPLTINLRRLDAPGNVLLTVRDSQLRRDSVANVSQLLTIDRSRLTERVGRLPSRVLTQIDEGLKLVLSLKPDPLKKQSGCAVAGAPAPSLPTNDLLQAGLS